jgi:hypothetical protein
LGRESQPLPSRGAACWLFPTRALAQDQTDPSQVSGIELPARRGRTHASANAMLWPFRLVVDLIFFATGTAGLLENTQIVRGHVTLLHARRQARHLPTVFVETSASPNVGVRLIASIEPYAAVAPVRRSTKMSSKPACG